MRKLLSAVVLSTVAIVLGGVSLAAQNRPLAPLPDRGLPVSPFMEGWYANEDGSVTISYGYLNRNREEVVHIPIGERNSITPDRYSGMQPTVFLPGRHRGVFTVTLPQEEAAADALWSIRNSNGETHEVPGHATSHAYELDRLPRPAGSLPPRVAVSEGGPWGWDPTGVATDRVLNTTVGQPLALSIWTEDVSQRDPADPRFEEAKSIRVLWMPHQAPTGGAVTFARHESTPVPPASEGGSATPARRVPPPPGPEQIMLPDGSGVARVYATFDRPGQYIVRAQVDNWRSPDSSSGDQCCWSNAFLRINVTQ